MRDDLGFGYSCGARQRCEENVTGVVPSPEMGEGLGLRVPLAGLCVFTGGAKRAMGTVLGL